MTVTYKDWHGILLFALHGYRTLVRTSIGTTPFSLVYWVEAVLPIDVEVPSLRIVKEVELKKLAEWTQTRYEELYLIEDRRLAALCRGRLY
ncbi:Pol polyprotein [Cucumis melo var. makuwa]|uniref:Pol polyprotein n=1 Tax=Cucumis melo var. makuwa TaxID=1194695 RepID=A0A5A7SMX3_CUCMM|nr:Pol polyprotein [Cucumis melo var. makuwa]TYJ96348.1 Pol polyprotein [Cucumis melo var. makuwa]